jgi:hypothetical protein
LNLILTVWDSHLSVSNPEITLLDQNEQTLQVIPEGSVLKISLSMLLSAAGAQLDDINPQPIPDSDDWAPTFRFSGIQMVARLRYRNLKSWSTSSQVKAELRIDALKTEWALRNKGFYFTTSTSGNPGRLVVD